MTQETGLPGKTIPRFPSMSHDSHIAAFPPVELSLNVGLCRLLLLQMASTQNKKRNNNSKFKNKRTKFHWWIFNWVLFTLLGIFPFRFGYHCWRPFFLGSGLKFINVEIQQTYHCRRRVRRIRSVSPDIRGVSARTHPRWLPLSLMRTFCCLVLFCTKMFHFGAFVLVELHYSRISWGDPSPRLLLFACMFVCAAQRR